MKYFFIETDERNRIPYSINRNRALDVRKLNRKEFGTLPMWITMEMEVPMEVFFPDLLCSPCTLVSETFMEAAAIYQPDIPCKGVQLWDKESGLNADYLLILIEEVDCLSDETEYNSVGNRIVRMVLDRDRIGDRALFRVRGCGKEGIVGRSDFLGSLMRRGGRGFRLEEIEVREK